MIAPPLIRGVTVVVATHNRFELLDGCLSAIREQTLKPNSVIVVDDGSTDATREVVARAVRSLPLHAIRLDRNRGAASARNRGIAHAKTDLIAFTDDDCEPDPTWLGALVTALGQAAEQVAGVGGRVLPAREGTIGAYMTRHRILDPPPSASYLVTANCIYRRAALLAVGGFDERIGGAGGEDPGLSYALRKRGFHLGLAPEAVVRHHYRESVIDFAKTFYRYGRGCRLVMD